MKKSLFIFFISILSVAHAQKPQGFEVAFVMDLSGSTNGLLNEFRNSYYYIINEVQAMKPTPELKIAVIVYGRPSFGKERNYVKILNDFTQNFDTIQYQLIQLKTSIEKGNQFVGDALQVAIRDLSWNSGDKTIKLIYLIGNGMVNTNMAINNVKIAEEAVKKNIRINSFYVFVGKKLPKEILGWRAIADNTSGIYAEAAINRKQPNPELAPRNYDLIQTNRNLNSSLLPYKAEGGDMIKMTEEIDRYHYVAAGYSFEDRIYFKTTSWYQNCINSWDLISSSYKEYVDVATIDKTFLPVDFQNADDQKLKTVIYVKRVERTKAQKEAEIVLGGAQRHKTIRERLIELQMYKSNTLARVIVISLREIAANNGIRNP